MKTRLTKIIFIILGLIYILYVGFPFYWLFTTSIKPKTELFILPIKWWPGKFEWYNYVSVWKSFPLSKYFLNSIFVTAITVILAIFISSSAGYALSRIKFKGNSSIITLLLITQMLPGIVTLVPFYFWMVNLGLVNTYWGLIFAYSTWSIPFCTLMLRGYFKTACPQELEEAALIDGCNRFSAYYRIALPLSVPGLVAAGAYSFMLAWKEFMWASIMISSGSLKTLPVGLYDMIGEGGNINFLTEFMTASILTCIPVLIIFFIFQSYIVSGLTQGAVKG